MTNSNSAFGNISVYEPYRANPIRVKLSQNTRETGFITASQPFDIAIIFERSPKK